MTYSNSVVSISLTEYTAAGEKCNMLLGKLEVLDIYKTKTNDCCCSDAALTTFRLKQEMELSVHIAFGVLGSCRNLK